MNRKLIPIILMLTAGAVASIVTYVRNFELIEMLWILLGVLILFYLFGMGIKKVLDIFDEQIKEAEEKEKQEEGSVIEKEMKEEQQTTKDATPQGEA